MENGELSSLKVGDKLYRVEGYEKQGPVPKENERRRPIPRKWAWGVEEYTVVWIGERFVFCEADTPQQCELFSVADAAKLYRSKQEAEKRAEYNNNEYIQMLKRTTCYECEYEKLGGARCQYCNRVRVLTDNYVPAKD